jgi:hypothetical protein
MHELVQHRSYLAITDYQIGDCKRVENFFTYVENWKSHAVGIIYNSQYKELRMFGGSDAGRIQMLAQGLPFRSEYYSFDAYEVAPIRLQGIPKSQLQKEMIQFLVGTGKYAQNANESQFSCNAETGEGKTFCAIAMMSFMRVKTMIIVNRTNIRNNWEREVLTFTDLDSRRLLVLDNGDIIRNILDGKMDASKYHVFIVIHRMLDNIAKERGWDAIGQLFRILKIGLKIYDEAHKEFLNTTFIDCHTNTYKTLYLTATLKLSNPKANFIYQNVFRNIPKFNQRALGYNDSKKHIVMLCFMYNSRPSIDWKSKCYNSRLKYFSAKDHSIYQIEDDSIFFVLIDRCIREMVIDKDYRMLILVSRTIACDTIVDFIKENYQGIKAGAFHSKISATDKEYALQECKIIVSTNASLGLGETIAGLKVVINAEAHRNFGDQASGRLRRHDDGSTCFYCEFVDIGFKNIQNQWKSRRKHYADIFKEVVTIKV